MPSFLYPAFLIGVLAAAIPVLLHLLRNQQAPEMRFSAVRLLRGVRVEHAQRRRIRDWLLLALRVSALLLLALAFARPYFAGDTGAAGRETILLIDRSASMSVPAVWAKAKASARAAIDASAAGEPLGLVAFDDRSDVVVEPTLDRAVLRSAVDRLQPGTGGTRYPAALARAVALLEDSDPGTGRIVVVSDLQGSPADARIALPASVTLEIVPAAAAFENIALLGTRRSDEGFLATVRNDGGATRRVQITSRAAAQPDPQEAGDAVAVDVPPGQTVEALIPSRLRAGDVTVTVAASEGNALAFDDVRYASIDERRRPRVLLVAPEGEAFYTEAALRAGAPDPDFDVARIPAQAVASTLAAEPPPDAVFVLGPRGLDRGGRDALVEYARRGGGVLIAASDPGFSTLVEGLDISAPRGNDAIVALASFDSRHPLFAQSGAIAEGLADARFTRAWRVRAKGWQPIARFDDGSGALFERAEGRGRLLFLASDLNRGWNDLPVQPAFVPFVQETARYLGPRAERREYTPGTLPAGEAAMPGFVSLASGRRVVVNPDARESEPDRMDAAAFQAALTRRPDRKIDQTAARRRVEATERGQALWRYGLMLMFATLVAEGIAGSRVRRA